MTTYLPRSAWTSTGPRERVSLVKSKVKGVAVHWPGTTGRIGDPGQRSIALRLEGYRRFHRNTRGWFDIAYQVAIDQAGRVWELRGETIESGANGSTTGNREWGAVLLLLGPGEQPSDAMVQAFRDWRTSRWLKHFPKATAVVGHGDIRPDPTDCPGAAARALIRSGALIGKGSSTPAKPAPPEPAAKPAVKPAARRPKPLPAFPLPAGYYFGLDDGRKWSVSGEHGRRFKGRLDKDWIKLFANQLAARGWSVGKGKTWLSKYGNDGIWGDEYDALCRAFQRDQQLRLVDGKCGKATWRAASSNPIT